VIPVLGVFASQDYCEHESTTIFELIMTGFERMVSEEAEEIFERETKKVQRSSSGGSEGSGGKGKKKKFEL
jgi:hypothetical protein